MDIKRLDINQTAFAQQTSQSVKKPVANTGPPSSDAAKEGQSVIADTVNISSELKNREIKTGDDRLIENTAKQDGLEEKKDSGNSDNIADKITEEELLDIKSNKAYFAVDEEAKQVVIKVVDQKGNVVKQIPPEEYIRMAQKMKISMENLFHTKA